MTHLKIQQNTTGIEEVSHSIIEKLYNLAISGDLDVSSNLLGRLHTPIAYRSQVLYLTSNYPGLYINSDDYAIPFEDPNMITYLNSIGVGSNGIITESLASAASVVANSANTTVTKFNELKYFTGITSSKGGWDGSSSGNCKFLGWTALEEVDISNFTSIGHNNGYGYEDTFNGCASLKTVTASDKLIKIGANAFKGCSNLETISGLSGVIELGNASFHTCSKLTSDLFSNVLFKIVLGDSQFYAASSLTTIPLADTNTTIPTTFAQYATSLLSITIPEGVTTIGINAFSGCTSLTQVTLPSTCTTINRSAFEGCTSLLSINLPSTITNLNSYVFKDCSSVPFGNLSLPNLVSSHGWSAFENCLGLQKVSNLGSIPYLDGRFFSNCTNLTEVTLPSTCIGFAEGAFRYCSNLEKVNLEYVQYFDLSNAGVYDNCLKLRVLNYQNLLCPSGITQNNVTENHSYRQRGSGPWFIAPGATDIYLPKFDTIMGGRDDTSRDYHGWFSGDGWYRKSTGNTYTPAWNTIYLKDVTTVGKGAFCGCDIVNLVINSDVVPTVTELQWGYTTYNGKLFEGNHTIQHIYVKPELVNDFKNDTYWGEKASIIESIANCPRKTANEVLAGEVGLVDAWM